MPATGMTLIRNLIMSFGRQNQPLTMKTETSFSSTT